MEEQTAGSGSPPVALEPRRKTYPPDHKAAVLKALSSWTGSRRAFCQLQGINPATLIAWQRCRYPSGAKPPSSPKRYNTSRRRFYRKTTKEIKVRTAGLAGRTLRLATREAIFTTLCRFGLAVRTRGRCYN
jgi:hypothetical protein